ncbi:MAG TPA: CBS domain-containing protein [Firmicutes bacterium]|nr:CBS domain-containing protein [Bacillota bacterium]HBK67179.1 CBS domain-containing protein [Bacillota bacterium]HBT17078.1 CBS domain-containing protein [Bacillota bacterium]
MKIKEIMTDKVAFVSPETTVVETARLMQKHDVGSIPVCEGPNLVGIVTDRDIVVRNVAHGKNPSTIPVREIMTTAVKTIAPEMELNQVAELMSQQQIRRLPVVENNQLVGMVSLGDLATQAKHDVEVASTLGEISQPSRPEKI